MAGVSDQSNIQVNIYPSVPIATILFGSIDSGSSFVTSLAYFTGGDHGEEGRGTEASGGRCIAYELMRMILA